MVLIPFILSVLTCYLVEESFYPLSDLIPYLTYLFHRLIGRVVQSPVLRDE